MATKTYTKKPASQDMIEACFAKAVADGDIVNFRFLFVPNSPLRAESTEDIETEKYRYLRPEDTGSVLYKNALDMVKSASIRDHISAQLDRKGPPQYPSELLVLLADNAVRLGKYGAAAQAYELLRIRRRMRDVFLGGADEALAKGDLKTAVRGYIIGAGLDYDYAAFPEPLPQVPDFQAKALALHADYPQRPEDSLPLQAPEQHLRMALDYLLIDADLTARLDSQPFDTRIAFFKELVLQRDPNWTEFVKRYKETCAVLIEYGQALERQKSENDAATLASEVAGVQDEHDPRKVPATLLGREIEDGAWWQYLKELAYQHPAAALFVARQAVTPDLEIIMPRFAAGSPLVTALNLA